METERRLKDLKTKLFPKYKDVFKKKLEPEYRIDAKLLKMEINENANICPRNCMSPAEILLHLRKAADAELKDALEAGFIEPCTHAKAWWSRSFFVEKPGVGPTRAGWYLTSAQ